MVWSDFQHSWQKLSRKPENGLLSNAVRSWCAELSLPEDEVLPYLSVPAYNIRRGFFGLFGDLAFKIYREAIETRWLYDKMPKSVRDIGLPEKDDFINKVEGVFDDMKQELSTWSSMRTDYVVLIAFFLVAVGYALFRISRRDSEQGEQNSQIPGRRMPSKQKERWILVLVINADKTTVLQTIQNEGKLTPDLQSSLYRATQALWLGSETEFQTLSFPKWFSSDSQVDEYSEYDVHLAKVTLGENDSRFGPSVNQMDRMDAFEQLVKRGVQVELSPRVSSEAYALDEIYSR